MTGSRMVIWLLTAAALISEEGSITLSTVCIVVDFEEATLDKLRGPTVTLLGFVVKMDPATAVIITDPWKESC